MRPYPEEAVLVRHVQEDSLPARMVLHVDFVPACRGDHGFGLVCGTDRARVLGVGDGSGDDGSVGVAVDKGEEHLGILV